MFSDGFKRRYTTIPFAVYKNRNEGAVNLYSHYHKEIELIVVIEGAIDFYIGADRYEMHAGEVLVIPPYGIHYAQMCAGTYHACICFDLSVLWDDALRRGLENGELTVHSHLSNRMPYTADAYHMVIAAITAYENQHPGWEMEAIGNLSVLFGKLCAESFFVKSGIADADQSFLKSVIEYVKNHFNEPITSSHVAESLYLNNSYFCRLFRKKVGCSFTEYLMSYRIEQARFLLNTTKQSVSDIALNCGFHSFSYFSKVFKEAVGSSPSEYRKKNESAL